MKSNERNWIVRLKTTLLKHYLEDQPRVFRQFRSGVIVFGVGLVIIFIAQSKLSPSLQQELVVLLGLLLIVVGFLFAILAQIRLLIGRILRFWRDK